MLRSVLSLALAIAPLGIAAPVLATPGGLDAKGCHNDRKGGTGYHCHRAQGDATSSTSRQPRAAFANCAAARAAGAAPVMRGDPGFSPRLDRDNDGIGCE